MCGRYYFDIDEKELKEIVEAAQWNINKNIKAVEIYPANIAPILTSQGAVLAKWGFSKWNHKGIIINARAENLTDKRMFKSLVNSNRCIVPASAYFEWKIVSENSKLKDKYIIKKQDSILYMAGLYNVFKDNYPYEQLSLFNKPLNNMLQYTIITKEANEYVTYLHDRMPLIFNKDDMLAWLQGEDLQELLRNNNTVLEYSIS